MRHHRRAIKLAGLLAAASSSMIIVGCTSSTAPHEYEKAMTDAREARIVAISGLESGEHTDDLEFLVKEQKEIRLAADELDSLEPPKDVKDAHEANVDGLYSLAKLLGKLADCARVSAKDTSKGQACRLTIGQEQLDEVTNNFDTADSVYKSEGYSLTPENKQAD